MERKHYIDNLRWICIALLLPYHAAMAFNCWGESNYIVFGANRILSSFVVAVSPWFMTLLFLLAGMSARYSLTKRSHKQFMAERAWKLLIPLLFGLLVFMPALSYLGDKTNCGYTGGYFEHYAVFFTKWTDLTGYDGGFGVGHLWFLLFLFVISSLVCLFDFLLGKHIARLPAEKTQGWLVALMIVLAMCAFPVKLAGKSVVTFLLLYLIGYYVLSAEGVVEKLKNYLFPCLALWVTLTALNVWLFLWTDYDLPVLNNALNLLAGAAGILTLLILGNRFLNRTNRTLSFLSSISFPVYIVHFIWVVAFEYWFSLANANAYFIFFLSTLCSAAATLATCTFIRYCPVLNLAFGYKFKRK